MEKLPTVAKSFFYYCKKCEAERYHRVLAHTTSTSAKIECEVCGSKKSYKIESEAAPKKKRTITAAATSNRKKAAGARSAAAKQAKHMEEFSSLRAKIGENTAKYNMRAEFSANQALEHPKFGLGFVIEALPEKIEVVFQDEVRSLVHNRQ